MHYEPIQIFPVGTRENHILHTLAEWLTERSKKGVRYFVGECYFDFGQDWKWTTVLAERDGNTWQALCPREQKEALFGGVEGFNKVVDEYEEIRF